MTPENPFLDNTEPAGRIFIFQKANAVQAKSGPINVLLELLN